MGNALNLNTLDHSRKNQSSTSSLPPFTIINYDTQKNINTSNRDLAYLSPMDRATHPPAPPRTPVYNQPETFWNYHSNI